MWGAGGAAAEIERPSLSSNAREGICEGSRPGPWGVPQLPGGPGSVPHFSVGLADGGRGGQSGPRLA